MSTTTAYRASAAFLIWAGLLSPAPLSGQHHAAQTDSAKATTEAKADKAAQGEERVSPASPRASLERYLDLSRAGRFEEAAVYLDLPESLQTQGATLAKHLKAVLDHHIWFDLNEISGSEFGDTADGLPSRIEQVGQITVGKRPVSHQPVRLTRWQHDGETTWRFSRSTVERVPKWYHALSDRWMLENLPPALLRPGPLDLVWWQWLALPLLLVIAIAIGLGLSRILRSVAARIAARTTTQWDDEILAQLGGPLTAACTLIAIGLLLPFLGLYEPAADLSYRLLRGTFLLIFFWALWRLVDVGRAMAAHTSWALTNPTSRALVPIGSRVAKVVVMAFAAVAVLSLLGYPVASLIAGLGLGGLAFALAAQKTVENMFGAFSIGVDQPFREGDFVKVEDFVGTVEAIGLRSTRFRTLDRTIVSIPNGRLADMKLESFTVRDRFRLAMMVGLSYDTTPAQMREVLSGFEQILRGHPNVWPDGITVRFSALGTASLDIEVMAWFQTADWGAFQVVRQDILLQFMGVVERAGTTFASPTKTLRITSAPVESLPPSTSSPTERP